jgi:hypothetical protein
MESASNPFPDAGHSSHSSAREKVLEHLFIGDLLRTRWRRDIREVEVLRGEVDRGGYDVVLEYKGLIRHIQLKSSYRKATTRDVTVNVNLTRKPSGCVVWLQFDPETMELGPFLWFGAEPGQPLPLLGERIAKHSRANSGGIKGERANIRLLRRTQFKSVESMDALIQELLGL